MMRLRFTDEQLRTMRATIMQSMPPDRMASFLRWILPSLNLTELTGMVAGAKATLPPEKFQFLAGIGAKYVAPERWQLVQQRFGV